MVALGAINTSEAITGDSLSHKEAQKAQNQQDLFELFVLLCGQKRLLRQSRHGHPLEYMQLCTLERMIDLPLLAQKNSLQDTTKAGITPGDFQEICNQAVLAVDLQRWDANAAPYELAVALVTEVHKRICRQLRESYHEQDSRLPKEERIEKIVKLVSRHWTGPILVERTINETIKMVLEHWRERHDTMAGIGGQTE